MMMFMMLFVVVIIGLVVMVGLMLKCLNSSGMMFLVNDVSRIVVMSEMLMISENVGFCLSIYVLSVMSSLEIRFRSRLMCICCSMKVRFCFELGER